jgi:hypothetical protein
MESVPSAGKRDSMAHRRAEGDARNVIQRPSRLQCPHQSHDGFLAFTANDDVDLRFGDQDFAPVERGEHAAVDDPDPRQGGSDRASDIHRRRMARGRTRMADHHNVRATTPRLAGDSGHRHRTELGIEESDPMAGIQQRPANG